MFRGDSKNGLNSAFNSMCLRQIDVGMLCWVFQLIDRSLEDRMQVKKKKKAAFTKRSHRLSVLGSSCFSVASQYVNFFSVLLHCLHLTSKASSHLEDVKETSRILTVRYSQLNTVSSRRATEMDPEHFYLETRKMWEPLYISFASPQRLKWRIHECDWSYNKLFLFQPHSQALWSPFEMYILYMYNITYTYYTCKIYIIYIFKI